MLNGEIRTRRTVLRKYTEADRAECVRIMTDPEVNKYMGGRTEDQAEGNNIFDRIAGIYSGSLGTRHFEIWAIEFEGKLIGDFELKETANTLPGELEVVYMIDKPYWGMGIVPEILVDIIKYSTAMNKKIIATLNPENIQTVRVLEKAGIEKQKWVTEGEETYYKIWLKEKH